MAITTTKPTVLPANEEIVYDQVWMRRLVIQAPDMNGEVNVNVNLIHYREVQVEIEGETVTRKEQAPGDGVNFRLRDVYNTAEYDTDQLAVLMPLLESATREQRFGLLSTIILQVTEDEAKAQNLI
jgi:hypothetical protein